MRVPFHRAGVSIIFLCLAAGGRAQDRGPRRTPVTSEEVGQAIAKSLRGVLPREPSSPAWGFEIPLAVPAANPHALQVVSMCRDADPELLRVRLACDKPGACLPFLAYVKADKPVPVHSCGPQEAREPRSPRPARIVHAGDRATAVMVTAGFRMSAAVRCLDGGGIGETIRVRAQEGRIFRARISGPAQVEVKGGE